MKKYVCKICGYEYDPAVGDPDNGIAPGTAFEDIPEDWACPLCGVGKDDFEPVDYPARHNPGLLHFTLGLHQVDIDHPGLDAGVNVF